MSNEIFPVDLAGLAWNTTKKPQYNTKIMKSINGRELRGSFQATPIYEFSVSFEFLRQNNIQYELELLEGFYTARQGAFDSFLFPCPDDCDAINQIAGVGDGAKLNFQMSLSYGGQNTPIINVIDRPVLDIGMWLYDQTDLMWNTSIQERLNRASPMWSTIPSDAMWSADFPQAFWSTDSSKLMWYDTEQFSVTSAGVITLNKAPPLGRAISWSGKYYYRCRFKDDTSLSFNNFMDHLWETKSVTLIGSLSNKI